MRIAVGFATQEDIILTPQFEPGAAYVTVQLQDDDGVPISDVHLIPITGKESDIYLMPLLVAGMTEGLHKLIEFFQKAIRFAGINGGQFNAAAFIDTEHKTLHTPVILPPVPQPSPVTPTPAPVVTDGLTLSQAQVKIDAYARARGNDIGAATGQVFPMTGMPGVYARNHGRGGQTKDICIIVCSKDGTYLVRNDFMLQYSGDNYNNRARLGPPIEDEHAVQGGAEQRFQKGRMLWRKSTGKVEVYDLQGKRIN